MDPAVRERLRQRIHVRHIESYSESGTEVLGEPREVACYIETHVETLTGPGGTERKLATLVITEAVVGEDERVYLPGVDESDASLGQRPDKVVSYPDPFVDDAVDHYEVWL